MQFIKLIFALLLTCSNLFAVAAYQTQSAMFTDATPHVDMAITLPAHATGDILFLMSFVRDTDDTATITVATGWAAVTGFPVDRGTTARYWLWWKRAASGAETNPTIDFSGTTGDAYAVVFTYRGVDSTGNPWEAIGTPTTGTGDPAALSTISSLTSNALIVVMLMGEDNNNAAITTTGTDPAAYTEHYDESGTGADAMVGFAEATRASNGATGTVNTDFDTAVPVGWGAVLMALKTPVVTCAQDIRLLGVGCR